MTATNNPSGTAPVIPARDLDGADRHEARRTGDERAAAGDWVGAVARWRAAAAAGDEEAIERLRGFVAAAPVSASEAARVPRRALGPLALCVEAALFGLLAMIAANRVDGGPDAVLLWVGWVAWAVSLAAAVVFAARSGRLDGSEADFARRAPASEVAARAATIAERLTPARGAGTGPSRRTAGGEA